MNLIIYTQITSVPQLWKEYRPAAAILLHKLACVTTVCFAIPPDTIYPVLAYTQKVQIREKLSALAIYNSNIWGVSTMRKRMQYTSTFNYQSFRVWMVGNSMDQHIRSTFPTASWGDKKQRKYSPITGATRGQNSEGRLLRWVYIAV